MDSPSSPGRLWGQRAAPLPRWRPAHHPLNGTTCRVRQGGKAPALLHLCGPGAAAPSAGHPPHLGHSHPKVIGDLTQSHATPLPPGASSGGRPMGQGQLWGQHLGRHRAPTSQAPMVVGAGAGANFVALNRACMQIKCRRSQQLKEKSNGKKPPLLLCSPSQHATNQIWIWLGFGFFRCFLSISSFGLGSNFSGEDFHGAHTIY